MKTATICGFLIFLFFEASSALASIPTEKGVPQEKKIHGLEIASAEEEDFESEEEFEVVMEEHDLDEESELLLEEEDDSEVLMEEEPDLEEESELLLEEDESGEIVVDAEQESEPKESLVDQLLAPVRFSLSHEYSYKTKAPTGTINNRSSIRLEYSKFFATYYSLVFDGKINFFHQQDHLAKVEDKSGVIDSNIRDAYLQVSVKNTSIKIGSQILVWGEADGGIVTDVISPRDSSELFFISLDESRIAQTMIVVDQYSEIGTWQVFVNPNPKSNKVPEKGSEYDLGNSIESMFKVTEESNESKWEFGFRWKQTFGNSDLALMYASLLENQQSYEAEDVAGSLKKHSPRYRMGGVAFNYSSGNFLWKGEIAGKQGKSFSDRLMNRLEKDVIDTAFELEYSSGGAYALTLSTANSRVLDWDDAIQGVREQNGNVAISWQKNYLNDDLSLSLAANYQIEDKTRTYTSNNSYTVNDHLKTELNLLWLDVEDDESLLWAFRDQNRVTAKVLYQF